MCTSNSTWPWNLCKDLLNAIVRSDKWVFKKLYGQGLVLVFDWTNCPCGHQSRSNHNEIIVIVGNVEYNLIYKKFFYLGGSQMAAINGVSIFTMLDVCLVIECSKHRNISSLIFIRWKLQISANFKSPRHLQHPQFDLSAVVHTTLLVIWRNGNGESPWNRGGVRKFKLKGLKKLFCSCL